MPFANKISCFVSTCVSLDNSFPSIRQEPIQALEGVCLPATNGDSGGILFTETDILTTQGTQGPACLQMDQTSGRNWDPFVPGLLLTRTTGQSAPTGKEQETLLTSLPFPLSFLSLTLPILPRFF